MNEVYSWGKNKYGELGHGDCGDNYQNPKIIDTLKSEETIQVACGAHSSFAVTSGGKIYSWGSNRDKYIHVM